MKNFIQTMAYLTATASLCALASCTSEEMPILNEKTPGHSAPQTLTALMPGATDTRVAYEEKGNGGVEVLWKNGDEIEIRCIDSGDEHSYRYWGTEPTNFATFELDESEGELEGDFYAFYKVDVSYTNYSIETPYSGFGQRGDNTFDHLMDYNSMIAKGTCTNGVITAPLQFQPMMAMLSFNVTMPEGEKPASIRMFSETPAFPTDRMFNYKTDEPRSSGRTGSISMNLVDIETNTFTANTLLTPLDMTGITFYVAITGKNGKVYMSDAITATNFEAGKRYSKTVSVEDALQGEGSAESPWLISDADDLRKIALLRNAYINQFSNDYFRLENDIDLQNQPFIPIESLNKVTFDGNGKRITGLKIEAEDIDEFGYGGLFAELTNSVLKDLTVEGEMVTFRSAGGIVGRMTSTSLAGHIVSNVKITLPEKSNINNTVGGIVGNAESNCEIADGAILENHGDITGSCAGGIFGMASNLKTYENCTLINTGDITAVGSSGVVIDNVYAGGFFGNLFYSYLWPSISAGQSTGKITAQSVRQCDAVWAGWAVGWVNYYSSEMTDAEATQIANSGYEGTPEVTATNPDGGTVYINGVPNP